MSSLVRSVLALVLLALPALGQTAAKLKAELKTKEAAAKKDPDALFEVGKWASEKALVDDAKRLYEAVLKIKPEHAGAQEALGRVQYEGKWMTVKEADALRKKAQAAEFAAKGMVEVSGVWVDKAEVDDAKKGVFHHDGKLVTKDEKLAFLAGMVRHPETGELIDAKHLEKAQNKYFPVGSEGRWVDEKEADTYHSDVKRPWLFHTEKGMVQSTLSLAKIRELAPEVDKAVDKVMPLLGVERLHPARRPLVLIAATQSEYQEYGQAMGEGADACGAFLVPEEAADSIPNVGPMRKVICLNDKDMGTRWVRHATGLAIGYAVAKEGGVDLPMWLDHGLASVTSRYHDAVDSRWFAQQLLTRGGIGNVKAFFPSFAIGGDMDPTEISKNMYQAGLLVLFASSAKDEKVTEAWKAVTGIVNGTGKGALDKAVAKLQATLIEAQPKIEAFLQELAK